MMKPQPLFFSREILVQTITVLITVILCIFSSWYLLLEQPKAIQKHTIITSYVKDTIPSDTINRVALLTQYFNTTDSLKKEIDRLDHDYHDNIDLIINKANGWTAFWLAMITVLLGLMALWQGFRIIKNEEKFNELKNRLDDYLKQTGEKNNLLIEHSLEKLNEKYEELNIKNNDLVCSIYENRINSSMICINITDPVGALDSPSRNSQFKYLLVVISESFSNYLRIYENSHENRKYLPLVLMNIKLAISRARPAFTSFDQNVLFKVVDNTLEQVISTTKDGKVINDTIRKLLKQVDDGLKELVANIG